MPSATVGKGNYTYTVIQNWAKLPSGETFGTVEDVATDSQDRVYAFQRKDPPVVIFDRDGNYLSSWGKGAFISPHAIHIASDIVYLVDRNSSVCMMYTLDGKPIQMLGRHGVHSDTGIVERGGEGTFNMVPRAAGPFNYPTKMVPDSVGDLYVSDGDRNARVHRFSPEGRLKFSWGEPGTGRGQFHAVHSLVVHGGLVYVCDRENHRIQVFTTEGEHITTWTDLQRPEDISIDREGILYVTEGPIGALLGHAKGLPSRISVMDLKGNVLARFDCRGGHGSWVNSHGDIYVGLGDHIPGARGVDKYVRRR